MSRVLIVDDDHKFVSLLERGLRYEAFDVVSASTGEEALQAAETGDTDVVVLDIGMPGMDGFEVLRRLRLRTDVPVIMLTARDEVADKVNAFGLGADDYVPKPFAFDELLARIRAVLRRHDGRTAERLRFADVVCDLPARTVTRAERHIELTAREFDLFVYFLRHPGQVLSRSALLQAVWGYDAVDPNTVEQHVAHLRRKLGEPRVIRTVWGVGYALRAEP